MNSKIIPIALLAVLTITFGLPTNAFASNPDLWIPTTSFSLSGCPCPTAWILVTNDNPTVSAGREFIDGNVNWTEGYDDIDRRIREPNNTTVHDSTFGTPQTSETVRVNNPVTGSWDEFYKTYSVSSQDVSGAAEGFFFTTAYDWP